MKLIYTKAERVIGWLGPDEDSGSLALTSLETLFHNAKRYPDDFELYEKMLELLTVNGTYSINSNARFESNDRLEYLLLLLRRPFWKRIWILQELVLPSNLTLLCGEEFMDLPEPELFYNTVVRLSILPSRRPDSFQFHMWARLNECIALLRLLAALRHQHLHRESEIDRVWKGLTGFLSARLLLESHKASDPRDHVYGLMGLFELEIVPDYGKGMTVADVYLEIARHCLKIEPADKKNPLHILSFAGSRYSDDGSDSLTRLSSPSWVPDWTLPIPARIRFHRYPESHAFPSSRGHQLQIEDQRWLRGPAVVWDKISSIEHKTGFDLQEWDLVEKVVYEKYGDRFAFYPSGVSHSHAIIFLWVAGYDGSKNIADLQQDSDLFRSYETMLFANIKRPWMSTYGAVEISKVARLFCNETGPTGIMSRMDLDRTVPMNHRESYVRQSRQVLHDMRSFRTEKGYIGLGPMTVEVGDFICVLEGHKAPVILRRRESYYNVVGDCDVVGIMNGEVLEAVKTGKAEITEIEIR